MESLFRTPARSAYANRLKSNFRSISAFLFVSLLLATRLFAFQVVDTFDAMPTGLLTTVSGGTWQAYPAISQPVVAATSGGGNHVSFGRSTTGGPFVSMHRVLPSGAVLPATGLSTFHFRVRPRGARIDHSIGLADGLSAEPTFGDFHPQVVFLDAASNGTTHFRVAARSGGSTFEVLASAPKGVWYDFWIVTDRARGNYDVWYSADDAHPVLLANDYDYRTPSTLPFTILLGVCNGQNSDNLPVDFDDFYVRPGRMDLSRPTRPGIQPAALRVATFNTHSGNGTTLTNFRDNYLNGEHVICLQEVQQADWNAIQAAFPNHPHRLLTVKHGTIGLGIFKTECLAILSSLPFLETDANIIQTDPQGDGWERWAQYVKVDLGGGRSARIFHFHNTYNFGDNNFESEKSGLQKFRDWILQKTGAASLPAVPDLIALGDFNLTSSADVLAIMPMPLVRFDWVDCLMANYAAKASTTLWTASVLSDHNGLAASLAPPVLHDRYAFWAAAAFSDAELRAGLGAPTGDSDGNGRDHFTDYALNFHPWRNQPDSSATVSAGVFRFRRGAGRADVRFTLNVSTNLATWDEAAVAAAGGPMIPTGSLPLSEMSSEGGETILTVLDPAGLTPPRGFYRQGTQPAP